MEQLTKSLLSSHPKWEELQEGQSHPDLTHLLVEEQRLSAAGMFGRCPEYLPNETMKVQEKKTKWKTARFPPVSEI